MPIKVVLMGNRILAAEALKFFVAHKNIKLLVIANPSDDGQTKGKAVSLIEEANKFGVNWIQPPFLNDNVLIEKMKEFAPDIVLSCSYEKIIPKAFRELPKIGIYNFHYALLPLNRGCLPVVYAMANGEPVGVTLHEIDGGVDTGPIVAQQEIYLDNLDTAETVNYKCCERAVDMLKSFFNLIEKGERPVSKIQNSDLATYHKQVFPEDRWVSLDWNSERVKRFINALTFFPHPCARIKLDEKEYEIIGPAQVVNKENIKAGKVWAEGDFYYLGCNDGIVKIKSIQ